MENGLDVSVFYSVCNLIHLHITMKELGIRRKSPRKLNPFVRFRLMWFMLCSALLCCSVAFPRCFPCLCFTYVCASMCYWYFLFSMYWYTKHSMCYITCLLRSEVDVSQCSIQFCIYRYVCVSVFMYNCWNAFLFSLSQSFSQHSQPNENRKNNNNESFYLGPTVNCGLSNFSQPKLNEWMVDDE